MTKKLWDVIIVGGGPAGITAALRLAKEQLDVLVVEAAVYPGAENWSGAVYFAERLADPKVLGVEELERAPFERRVVKRGFFSCDGFTMAGAEYRDPDAFRHCYTVLRPVFDRYLAERARQSGVTLLSETTADGLIRHGNRVIGVHTDRGPLYGEIVFLAEGDASHLVSKEGLECDAVRARPSGQPAFLQGVKEVIELGADVIERRFGVGPNEAACYEILLRNGQLDGKPVRLNMAGLIYTNRSSVSIGLVLPLQNLSAFRGDYNVLMEWYKSLPPIQRLIEGGESTSYGAKIIRGGGLRELPALVDHGVAIGGAATGIGVDFPYPNYTGPACAMGAIFGEAAIQLLSEGERPTRDRLEELYAKPLRATNYYEDVEFLRDWPAFIEHSEALFARQIDLLNGSLYTMTRPKLGFARKWGGAIRLVGTTLNGEWSATLRDLGGGAKALGLRRSVLKHAPLALLLAIPNTLLALLPFTWGRGTGELRFTFWANGEETGKLPWFKRWLAARYTPALARAAGVLYANDGRPLRAKLDRCVGLVLRRLSLWEVAGSVVGLVGFVATRGVQRLRGRAERPGPEEASDTAYGRWLANVRAYQDLAAGARATARSHDAKLGEISYAGEPGAHIKVFFPPDKPGKLPDPCASSLWSVCPAAVYQINLDRTQHASVAVNFDNCVKCETCWRIEPRHVDWTRFGKHRLVYEVYTPADAALQRILAEREIERHREIEPDFWRATLRERWRRDTVPAASAELRDALAAARHAIAAARAYGARLSEDLWNGPRVLEPGQFAWYRQAVDYFARLAQDAAAAALAEPIDAWLTQHGLIQADVSFHQVKRDLEALATRAREHASAGRFFAAEADARQICDHHLDGLHVCVDHVADACDAARGYSAPALEEGPAERQNATRATARESLRARFAQIFDRAALRRLEHGGDLESEEVRFLKAAARAVLGATPTEDGYDELYRLTRADILAELARVDSSLAAIVASHAAAVEALARAGAHDNLLEPLMNAERFAAIAMESHAELTASGWIARLPFTLLAMADCFVTRGDRQVALFHRNDRRVWVTKTPAIGLTGAVVGEITLDTARPEWESAWDAADERFLFGLRARDVAAITLGAGTICVERTVEHALGRIQFPDMFQDIDGRDAIGKFGAVRAYCGRIEACRLAIETLLSDAAWDGSDGIEAAVAKVAVTDIFGPDLPSLTYLAGQVIGGSAFSEEDIFSKLYRDSSVFPHYIRENAELNVEVGKRLAAEAGTAPLRIISAALDESLEALRQRPIFGPQIERLRRCEETLARALRAAAARGPDAPPLQAIHDMVGEAATRLYVWARVLVGANDRLERALPAERYVETSLLWADIVEERLVDFEPELEAAAARVDLGGYAFRLEGYPDAPIATGVPDFDYEKQIIKGGSGYKSGDFLLAPFDIEATRYLPELLWADETIRSHYEEYLAAFRQRFVDADYEPSFERYIEALHYIPREDIDWTLEQGYFRVIIPKEYGGQGRPKADYYSLCQISKRLADVSHTLTIQGNTSIGTTPMLLGLEETRRAERDLTALLEQADTVAAIEDGIKRILGMMEGASYEELKDAYIAVNTEVGAKLGRSRILKKVIFGKFIGQMNKAGGAGLKGDLAGFGKGLKGAVAALAGWRERAEAELDELPRRRFAHEFFLRLISARMISAFALTEPSAGSDTARVRTEARPDSRRVHTDADGIKFFYLDEASQQGRRNIADMRRFEFDGRQIFYRYSDVAEPAEVLSQEFTYSEGEEKYRYFMIGDRRIDIHDMAFIRERDGVEHYDFFVLNGAKMWITNGHIAGVEAIYARTPTGLTGFMVDALTEGFLVGKDEEKTGQRGSPTNEIGLTNVRIPKECIIGIEGRGQENALETLNVGRTGLCVSSAASIQQAVGDAAGFLSAIPRGAEGWARYRLGLALEEMFAVESIMQNLVGLSDDETSDSLRMEAAIAKLFGTDGLHRNLHFLEPTYGIEGQLQRYRIE
ncbi:MAG: acyl-CoA dehydrogenase family protein, partial [Gemmatimonadales bacterium]